MKISLFWKAWLVIEELKTDIDKSQSEQNNYVLQEGWNISSRGLQRIHLLCESERLVMSFAIRKTFRHLTQTTSGSHA